MVSTRRWSSKNYCHGNISTFQSSTDKLAKILNVAVEIHLILTTPELVLLYVPHHLPGGSKVGHYPGCPLLL